jgi:hypothetical protein
VLCVAGWAKHGPGARHPDRRVGCWQAGQPEESDGRGTEPYAVGLTPTTRRSGRPIAGLLAHHRRPAPARQPGPRSTLADPSRSPTSRPIWRPTTGEGQIPVAAARHALRERGHGPPQPLGGRLGISGSAHQNGPCRVGSDPARSVLDLHLPGPRRRQPLRGGLAVLRVQQGGQPHPDHHRQRPASR